MKIQIVILIEGEALMSDRLMRLQGGAEGGEGQGRGKRGGAPEGLLLRPYLAYTWPTVSTYARWRARDAGDVCE